MTYTAMQLIKKDLQQNKEKLVRSNEYLKDIEIKREFEIKNVYLDKNGNDITNNEDKWINTPFNKSIINFSWDNKNNLFSINFSFLFSDSVKKIELKINNDKTFSFIPKFDYQNKMYNYSIYSNNIGNGSFNSKNLKTLQIILKGDTGTKIINIILGNYQILKNDYFIGLNDNLKLSFQKNITIKGEKIQSSFGEINFEPIKLKQGFWNQEFIKIKESNSSTFERNKVEIISLENLPISSDKNSNFNCYFDGNENSGVVKVSQNTYYDLTKKETIKGFDTNSNSGYIIPFEFQGFMFPTLKLKINDHLFNLTWEQKIEKPYFMKNEGINKMYLSISYNKNKNLDWLRIDSEILDKAKEYNLSFEEFIQLLKK